MNRRKFMIGMGGTVAGSAAVLGSGAFTSLNAERTATVSVADDSTAYLGLDAATDAGTNTAGTIDSNFIQMDALNELEIAINESDAGGMGVNNEAVMQFGEITGEEGYPDPTDEGASDAVAFVMTNQFDQAINLNVSVTGANPDVLELPFAVVMDSGLDSAKSDVNLSDVTDLNLLKSEEIYVVVRVDTTKTADLSGSEVTAIEFRATPSP